MLLISAIINFILGIWVLVMVRYTIALHLRIAALEKAIGSGPVVPRSPGLPQSGGPGVGHPLGATPLAEEAHRRVLERLFPTRR
jgi:hypothetical protein